MCGRKPKKKIHLTLFVAIFVSLRWSGTKPAISLYTNAYDGPTSPPTTPAFQQILGSGGQAQGYKPGRCPKIEMARQAGRAGLPEAKR